MTSLIIIATGIILCIVLSGVFSASEMAISSCNRVRMENEAEDGNKAAARVVRLNSDYDNTLSTILLSNNLVNIAAYSLSFLVKQYLRSSARSTPTACQREYRDS